MSTEPHAITPEPLSAELRHLLQACDLPISDLAANACAQFFGRRAGSRLVAVIGLECYGPHALLRSLAVTPAARGHGHARTLIEYAERFAADQGTATLYLLTTTAAPLFVHLGYQPLPRSEVPLAIQATPQFAGVCPASATCLCKSIAHTKCAAPAAPS